RQKKEKARESLHQRIMEIRRRINRGDITDALGLARETLALNGPNAQLSQMVSAAEVEFSQKQEKLGEQRLLLTQARDLLQEGQVQEAAEVLRRGTEHRLLSEKDSEVRELLGKIEETQPASAVAPAESESSVVELQGKPVDSASLAKDYVFQELAPFAKPSPA